MIFQLGNHPFSEESSLRDDFPQKKSSCFRRMLFWGLLFSEEIILIQKNSLSGMIFLRRNHPVSEESSPRDDFPQQNASCFRGILSQGLFSSEECILFQRNPLPGMISLRRMHPVSEETSPRDAFPQQKSSCFRGILSKGCFSTAEIILFQRNPLSGMIFHRRKHPDSEESSLRDDSQA